ncbi:hypothetical protein D3C81_2075570 [compost metagenome]
MVGHHFEVVGVGKRGFRAQTKTTGDSTVLTLGRITKHTVDRADLGMWNSWAKVTNDNLFIGDGDL